MPTGLWGSEREGDAGGAVSDAVYWFVFVSVRARMRVRVRALKYFLEI